MWIVRIAGTSPPGSPHTPYLRLGSPLRRLHLSRRIPQALAPGTRPTPSPRGRGLAEWVDPHPTRGTLFEFLPGRLLPWSTLGGQTRANSWEDRRRVFCRRRSFFSHWSRRSCIRVASLCGETNWGTVIPRPGNGLKDGRPDPAETRRRLSRGVLVLTKCRQAKPRG